MNQLDGALTEAEEQELFKLEKKSFLKKFFIAVIITSTVLLIYGTLYLFPFDFKIKGTWFDSEQATYSIENDGNKTRFRIKNIQDNPNLTLMFEGEVYGSGSNRYKVKNNQVYLEVNKSKISNQLVDELKNNTKAYKIDKETEDFLRLKYTEKSIKEAFPNDQLESMFYYELKPSLYIIKGATQLKLRNNTFADPTILFNK